MKFVSAEIDNFLAITHGKLSLKDRGLVLIQGVNLEDSSADSNGSGKSSLADALCWCLYGVTARGVSGDDVVNHDAGKGTRVEVVIQDGPERYWIRRHRKHKPGKNSLQVETVDGSGSTIDLTKGTEKLTQDVVNKIVGASLEVFRAAVYAGQEQMPDLPAMTDKHLKILIEEASGVALLEAAYGEARLRVNSEKATLQTIENSRDRAQQKLDWTAAQLQASANDKASWEANRVNEVANITSQVQALVSRVKGLDTDIAKVDELDLRTKIDQCDKKIAAVSTEQDQLRRHDTEIFQVGALLDQAHRNLQRAEGLQRQFNIDLQNVDHKVGCECGECGRPLTTAELAAARKAIEDRLAIVNADVENAKADIAREAVAKTRAQQARDTFAASMTDTSATSAQRATLQQQLHALITMKNERANVAQQARTLGERLKAKRAEGNPHDAIIARQQLEEKQALEQVEEFQAKVDAQIVEVETADIVAQVFSPAGVRAHILDEVTPFLNQQTARYLSTMSDGNIEATWSTLVQNAKGELREKFTIEVTNDKGGKSFAGLSGGEKRKVRISTALALQDLVATRATKPIDLFIGDEIDDALDQSGLERLTQILEEKAAERGSVFIISHNSLRDWVSQVITVEKSASGTKIVEETA